MSDQSDAGAKPDEIGDDDDRWSDSISADTVNLPHTPGPLH